MWMDGVGRAQPWPGKARQDSNMWMDGVGRAEPRPGKAGQGRVEHGGVSGNVPGSR